ncbi:MAG: OmpA family protein [Acidobacteria bacterium]|nr:OmpA family protein [Acidobacteriota bacterium]
MAFTAPTGDERQNVVATACSRLALWRATDLARCGRYAEAEALLNGQEFPTRTPAALDLLARIRAQQGRLTDAEADWREAARLEPANKSYQACLRRITVIQRRPRRWVVALATAILIAIIVVVATLKNGTSVGQLKGVANDVSDVTTAPPAASVSPKKELPLDPALSIPGAVVERGETETAVAFRFGLFVDGTRLKPEAKTALDALGRQLTAASGPLAVTIVGFTDDLPVAPWSRYRDNAELGLARAMAAYSYLRQATSVDPHVFTLRTSGAADPLTTPTANALDRRTVEFRISRGKR